MHSWENAQMGQCKIGETKPDHPIYAYTHLRITPTPHLRICLLFI